MHVLWCTFVHHNGHACAVMHLCAPCISIFLHFVLKRKLLYRLVLSELVCWYTGGGVFPGCSYCCEPLQQQQLLYSLHVAVRPVWKQLGQWPCNTVGPSSCCKISSPTFQYENVVKTVFSAVALSRADSLRWSGKKRWGCSWGNWCFYSWDIALTKKRLHNGLKNRSCTPKYMHI